MSIEQSLHDGIAALGLDLPAGAEGTLVAFARLLIKWNKVYNLTAIRDEAQVLSHHLLDSLSVLPHLEGIERLVDVGSGGGLPGIVLALCRPDMQVDSVETVQKKATFQNQAKIELKLPNFRAHHARIEAWQPAYAPKAPDGIISRAFADLADFVNLTAHLAGPQTRILAMKGVYPADEIARITTVGNAELIVLRMPIEDPDKGGRYSIVPLGIALLEGRVVTISLAPEDAVADVLQGCEMDVKQPLHGILQILFRVTDRYLAIVRRIECDMERLEDELSASLRNQEVLGLLALQKTLIKLATALRSNQVLLQRLRHDARCKVSPADRDLLRDVRVELQQAIEILGRAPSPTSRWRSTPCCKTARWWSSARPTALPTTSCSMYGSSSTRRSSMSSCTATRTPTST